MTDKKLHQGNELCRLLIDAKRSLRSIKKCLRDLELGEFLNDLCRVKLDSSDCEIDSKSLIAFLKHEVERQDMVVISLENEFNAL